MTESKAAGAARKRRERAAARVKRAAAAPVLPDTPVTETTVEVETPDGPVKVVQQTAAVGGESFRDRVRRMASGPAPRGPGRPPGSRNETVSDRVLSDGIIVPLLALSFLAVPNEYRMSDAEMGAAAQPMARILMRHVSALRRLSPDIVDLAGILAVLVAYGRRMHNEDRARRQAFANGQRPSVVGGTTAAPPAQQTRETTNGTSPAGDAWHLPAELDGRRYGGAAVPSGGTLDPDLGGAG